MNVAKLAYKNLQMAKPKPKIKGGGLLARNVSEETDTKNLEPNKRGGYVCCTITQSKTRIKRWLIYQRH